MKGESVSLMLALLLLMMVSKSILGRARETPSTPPPSGCLRSCGGISIEYPFGVGDDCSRRGFNLTCVDDGRTAAPKLFLGDGTVEVAAIDLEKGMVYVKLPNVTMPADVDFITAPLIDLDNRPFSFLLGALYGSYFQRLVDNSWYIIGCSVDAVLLDYKANKSIDTCFTMCSATTRQPLDRRHCKLNPYGKVGDRISLGLQLTRLSTDMDLGMINISSRSAISAVMLEYRRNTSEGDLQGLITKGHAALAWFVNDYKSCEEAKRNNASYACLSRNSECVEAISDVDSMVRFGYLCRCALNYHGNPYIPDGCQDSQITLTHAPGGNCRATECGGIDVPYPFGLSEGCYRDQSFAMSCSRRANPTTGRPTLIFRDFYTVSNILLEKGQLELKITNHFPSPLIIDHDINPSAFLDQQTVYDWVVAYQTCEEAKKNMTTFACVDELSTCLDVNITSNGRGVLGYRCKCSDGYEGNPYLLHGCTDIDECSSRDTYPCYGICTNTMGNYNCTCPPGLYSDDPKHKACTRDKRQPLILGVIIGVTNGLGLLLLCATFVLLRRKWKRRKQKIVRQKNFHENHGLLLKQLISTGEDIIERTKIFSLEEMEKATNNFDKTRVLGRGGHGTVYKGILSDQRVVAIKRSKIAKQIEIDQFINEVVILSQINHRHVVKLYGCCLETEVPLLIYEFVSNGTLSDHLHGACGKSTLSWEDRIRIAAQTAEALAYLHSAASISIFHRDVKSSNILLDDHFTAKVSDFGTSRFIPDDQTHLVTVVQGTFGYMDPEYYQTGQLTEKSDVYSFGVILLEVLTGRQPIYSTNDKSGLNLSLHFFQALRDNQLFDFVEDRVIKEGTKEEVGEIIRLSEKCINLRGAERPTMKEVEISLQSLLRRIRKRNMNHSTEEYEEESN